MTKRERERRRREKHKWQKAKRRENKIAEVERRLLGSGVDDSATIGGASSVMGSFFLRTARRISGLPPIATKVPGN